MKVEQHEADGIGKVKGSVPLRRRRVARMALEGMNQTEIAEELGVDSSTIQQDLARMKERWIKESKEITDELIRQQLGRISLLEQEYWDGWDRSQEQTIKITKGTKRSKKNGDESLAKVDKTTTAGDPRFLNGVANCIEQRRKLLGLDAPEKTESTIKLDYDDKDL